MTREISLSHTPYTPTLIGAGIEEMKGDTARKVNCMRSQAEKHAEAWRTAEGSGHPSLERKRECGGISDGHVLVALVCRVGLWVLGPGRGDLDEAARFGRGGKLS